MKKGNKFKHRVLAWMLVMAMAVGMMPMTPMAASAELAEHTHDGKTFTPVGVLGAITKTCSLYLDHDKKVSNDGIAVIGSGTTVDICLNGHTLDLGGKYIYIRDGATLNIYDCAGGGGKITGGKGRDHKGMKGGAIYVQGSTLNIYGGTIEGNEAEWGGAIFIDDSDCHASVYFLVIGKGLWE